MPIIIVLVLAALIGVPVALLVLFRWLHELRQRVNELEAEVIVLRAARKAAATREEFGAPVVEEEPRPTTIEILSSSRQRTEASPPPVALPLPPIYVTPTQVEVSPRKVEREPEAINWEQFFGVKLFAWLGGLALFMGVAFFLKYAFEHNLIAPWLRVAMGLVFGGALITVGAFARRRNYAVTAQTLVATGLVVLYAVSFTARALYHLINTPTLFLALCGITVSAFVLAIRFDAKVVAILGVLGGFLAPHLVGSKSGNPYVLFTYIAFLNAGLHFIGRRQGWNVLLPLGAGATILTELLWTGVALGPENVWGTVLMLGVLNALFVAMFIQNSAPLEDKIWPAFAHAIATFVVAGGVLSVHSPTPHPVVIASAIFLGNLALLALFLRAQSIPALALAAVGSALLVVNWMMSKSAGVPVVWFMVASLIHVVLNVGIPFWRRGLPKPVWLLAAIPFLLMSVLCAFQRVVNYPLAFAFLALMAALVIAASLRSKEHWLMLVALMGAAAVQYAWLAGHSEAGINLGWGLWNVGFFLAFTVVPFAARRLLGPGEWLPWRVSGLAGPLHFPLIYQAGEKFAPDFGLPGLIPALLGIPALIALAATRARAEGEQRMRFTAIYGASLLFFVTVIFPVQFEREWLTIGWALEGAALLWLYRHVPICWLPKMATGLLLVAFARFALNPEVFRYYERAGTPIFNWYLYAYGLVASALLAAARLARDERIHSTPLRPLFATTGVILLFLLMNIEIADFYATGPFVVFEFTGNFARDMTYSIAWAAFALLLLGVGAVRDLRGVRIAGIALMIVTLLKLFLHDLSNLDQLYRIGAFVGVAVILMVASWLYQKFVRTTARPSAGIVTAPRAP